MSQYTLLNKLPELGPVDTAKVMDDVRASLASYIEDRRGIVAVARLPAMVGNETLMTQVIQNLVVNGLKYNKSAIPRVDIDGEIKDGRCLFAVRDNGIGIEARFLSDIFKPLARLHPTSEYSGTGLGLTLARKAVVAQGGTIWCESTPGEGSTFWLDLPAPERATSAAA
jgi:light-regulated signal transduction histidine kinase (bacteriophytochrome)